MSRFTARTIMLVSLLGAFALAATATALATSSSGNQNAELVVSASLVSDGANPDVAAAGDTIQSSVSVTNVSGRKQPVRIIVNNPFKGPDVSHIRDLRPGETWTWSSKQKVKGNDLDSGRLAAGTYALDAFAVGDGSIDPSQAEATITVVNG